MRTGNVGTSTVSALSQSAEIEEIVGIARREPTWRPPKTSWVEADILSADLEEIFSGADAVIHLAWAIQPSRDAVTLERVNVEGSWRVFEAVAAAGVPKLVYASSVGVYFRRRLLLALPRVDRLRFQAVHSEDVGRAYLRAVLADVDGAFNIAAEPPLSPEQLADRMGVRSFPVPGGTGAAPH